MLCKTQDGSLTIHTITILLLFYYYCPGPGIKSYLYQEEICNLTGIKGLKFAKSNIWHLYKKGRKNMETHTEEKATYRCMKFKVAVPIDEEKRGPPKL